MKSDLRDDINRPNYLALTLELAHFTPSPMPESTLVIPTTVVE